MKNRISKVVVFFTICILVMTTGFSTFQLGAISANADVLPEDVDNPDYFVSQLGEVLQYGIVTNTLDNGVGNELHTNVAVDSFDGDARLVQGEYSSYPGNDVIASWTGSNWNVKASSAQKRFNVYTTSDIDSRITSRDESVHVVKDYYENDFAYGSFAKDKLNLFFECSKTKSNEFANLSSGLDVKVVNFSDFDHTTGAYSYDFSSASEKVLVVNFSADDYSAKTLSDKIKIKIKKEQRVIVNIPEGLDEDAPLGTPIPEISLKNIELDILGIPALDMSEGINSNVTEYANHILYNFPKKARIQNAEKVAGMILAPHSEFTISIDNPMAGVIVANTVINKATFYNVSQSIAQSKIASISGDVTIGSVEGVDKPTVTVRLFAKVGDGRQEKNTISLDKDSNYKYSFDKLSDITLTGREIEYTVEADDIDKYEKTVRDNNFEFKYIKRILQVKVASAQEESKLITGAEFEILDSSKNRIASFTTKSDVNYEIELDLDSTYTIKQTKASEGYKVANDSIVKIMSLGLYQDVTIKNDPITGSVVLTRIDAATASAEEAKQTKLVGSTFKLYRKDGTVVNVSGSEGVYVYSVDGSSTEMTQSTKDSDKGTIKVTGLPYGNYYFKETVAPNYYGLDNTELSFAVTEDGKELKIISKSEVTIKPAKLYLKASVTLDGGASFKSGFGCSLKQGDKVLSSKAYSSGEATNKVEYNFGTLQFSHANINKKYSLTIVHNKGTTAGITYDETVHNVVVRVSDSGKGIVKLDVEIDGHKYTSDETTGECHPAAVAFKDVYTKSSGGSSSSSSSSSKPSSSSSSSSRPSSSTSDKSGSNSETKSETSTTTAPTSRSSSSKTTTTSSKPSDSASSKSSNSSSLKPITASDAGFDDEDGTHMSVDESNNVANLYNEDGSYDNQVGEYEDYDNDTADDYLTYGLLSRDENEDNYEDDSSYDYEEDYDSYDYDDYYDDEEVSKGVLKARFIASRVVPRTPQAAAIGSLLPILVLMLFMLYGKNRWQGALAIDSFEGVSVRRARKSEDEDTVQDYIDYAYENGYNIDKLRTMLKKSKASTRLGRGMKMRFDITTPAGQITSREYRANEDKYYSILKMYEHRDCEIKAYVYKQESAPDIVLDYKFGDIISAENAMFNDVPEGISFDRI